jgi:hypothetical protein
MGAIHNEENNITHGSPSVSREIQQRDLARGLEVGIVNLHSHLKDLEGKYIDLANFYK